MKIFDLNENFMMTYGDSVANVNLRNLKKFLKKINLVTLTAVKPTARFGAIKIRGKVTYFKEKSSVDVGWINGVLWLLIQNF